MTPRAPLSLGKVLLVGAIVPTLFAWIDLQFRGGRSVNPPVYAIYVVQVGAIGVLAGCLIENSLVRRIVYFWNWLFVDLHVMADVAISVSAGKPTSVELLPASLMAAQIGLLSVWALHGYHSHWAIRWSVAIMGMAFLAFPFLGDGGGGRFAVQTITLLFICGALNLRGYRLLPTDGSSSRLSEVQSGGDGLRVQFGVRHVLIWTTTVAVSLALLRAFDLLTRETARSLFEQSWMTAITSGGIVAVVLLIALWAALGEGAFWVRWPAPFLAALGGGLLLHTIEWVKEWPPARESIVDPFEQQWYDSMYGQYDYWDAFVDGDWTEFHWVCLAGGLLFAGLLYFRVQGVRLARKVSPR